MAKALKIKEPPKDRFQQMLEGVEAFSLRLSEADWTYHPKSFGFEFLEIFSFPKKTLASLKQHSGSDIENALLLKGQIHLFCLPETESVKSVDFSESLALLRQSEKASKLKGKNKPRLLMVTNGVDYQGEDTKNGVPFAGKLAEINSGEAYSPFLPLIGIDYVAEIKETALDRRAAAKSRALYVELLKANSEWAKDEKRPALNFFLARLIFCLFADQTGIFRENSFMKSLELYGARGQGRPEGVRSVMLDYFKALGLKEGNRDGLPKWAQELRYVNGHLFENKIEVPEFSTMAWRYLKAASGENWKEINPDIFGSLIQTIKSGTKEGAEERGEDGIHYTSVSNILKLLNPLFLDELREEIEQAGDYKPKLKVLLERIKKIRVFDPACGSGNFLVIAYKELRKLEHEIQEKLGKRGAPTYMALENFRGIEKEDFPVHIARLALVVAKFQCDVLYQGEDMAISYVLPLDKENWITEGNALRLDWNSVCPVSEIKTDIQAKGLALEEKAVKAIDFEHEGGELYIVGNPPYKGSKYASREQKEDLEIIFKGKTKKYASLDYISGWFMKAGEIISQQNRTEQNRTEQNRTAFSRLYEWRSSQPIPSIKALPLALYGRY